MSIVNIKTNEYGDLITVANPNQTITNLQQLPGNIGEDNFKLRGLEVRNFAQESVTENISALSGLFRQWDGFTSGVPTTNMLDWFSGSHRYIGSFDPRIGVILIECSFAFRVVTTNGGTTLSSNRYPDLYFEIYHGDNPNGTNLTLVEGTRRRYSSNRGRGNIRVAGSCTIANAYSSTSSSGVYFYLGIRDMNYPHSQNPSSSTYTLRITDMTLMGRTYKR